MRPCIWMTIAVIVGSVAAAAPADGAEPKPVKFGREWKGSTPAEGRLKDVPEVVSDAKGLEKLWEACGIAGKVPALDFAREIVVVGTTVGSRLNLSAQLDENGNLRVLGLATADIGPGFRYSIATVPRAGVEKVNGKRIP